MVGPCHIRMLNVPAAAGLVATVGAAVGAGAGTLVGAIAVEAAGCVGAFGPHALKSVVSDPAPKATLSRPSTRLRVSWLAICLTPDLSLCFRAVSLPGRPRATGTAGSQGTTAGAVAP